MKTNKTRISLLALAVLLLIPLITGITGCSRAKHTPDELRPILADLLPRAAEINEIYFGAGLPTTRDVDTVRAFYDTFDTDVESISYTPVDPACGYETVDDIKAATLEVFSPEYAAFLFDRAFNGISDLFDEGLETEHRTTAVYAMYIEESGYLTKRVNLLDDAIPLGRTYDLDSITVLRENESGVEVRLKSFFNGEPSVDVDLWLVEGADGWRLDSPTY
ncbi:MAG: hypothetical protein J6Q17_09050 [Clostridia bacterium]|nr:hypothetical protein [Clostridia bacterium]